MEIKAEPDSVYGAIYKLATPYLDTRHNDIHISLAYGFAGRLLALYPEADEKIVLPAVVLHDAGWKMVPVEKQSNAFGPAAKDKKTQRFHETEGVRIAEEILTLVNYDQKRIMEILSIIDGHDTRREALSLNDQLVKDADKLWRFTPIGVDIHYKKFNIQRDSHLKWLEIMINAWLFTPAAKKMAQAELIKAKCTSGAERI